MSVSPIGFAATYARVRRDPATPAVLADWLALVGWEASADDIARWPLERRVEAEVHAVNQHLRASDNVLRRHPRPSWMPEPWLGPWREDGAFSGPRGTLLAPPEFRCVGGKPLPGLETEPRP